MLKPVLKGMTAPAQVQIERLRYFAIDAKDARNGKILINRMGASRDSWAKAPKDQTSGKGRRDGFEESRGINAGIGGKSLSGADRRRTNAGIAHSCVGRQTFEAGIAPSVR